METIVPTSCIAVAGQNIRQWRKLYRNKIKMFGKSWTEHVYSFQPIGWEFVNSSKLQNKDPYEIRVYKNESGLVIWAVGQDSWGGTNGRWPEINKNLVGYDGGKGVFNYSGKTAWIGWKERFKRSYSDTKFLLSFERTREDFFKKLSEHRESFLLFPSKEVEAAVYEAVAKAEAGRGRPGIGTYSGPASLTIGELKALGCRVCHKPPTKKYPQIAPSDHVVENFNWGAEPPQRSQWFRYGAGLHYHGTVGCNAGWVWYD